MAFKYGSYAQNRVAPFGVVRTLAAKQRAECASGSEEPANATAQCVEEALCQYREIYYFL